MTRALFVLGLLLQCGGCHPAATSGPSPTPTTPPPTQAAEREEPIAAHVDPEEAPTPAEPEEVDGTQLAAPAPFAGVVHLPHPVVEREAGTTVNVAIERAGGVSAHSFTVTHASEVVSIEAILPVTGSDTLFAIVFGSRIGEDCVTRDLHAIVVGPSPEGTLVTRWTGPVGVDLMAFDSQGESTDVTFALRNDQLVLHRHITRACGEPGAVDDGVMGLIPNCGFRGFGRRCRSAARDTEENLEGRR